MSKPMDMNHVSEWVNEECPGESCTGCGSKECFSKGGTVGWNDDRSFYGNRQQAGTATSDDDSTTIYQTRQPQGPQSGYGHGWNKNSDNSYSMDDYNDPKTWRKNRVANAYSKGGEVKRPEYMSGAEHDAIGRKRQSEKAARETGASTKTGDLTSPKEEEEIRKGLKKYSEGGEVEMGDDEMDTALSDAACGELLESIEKKDKAGILEAIRALVLSVR